MLLYVVERYHLNNKFGEPKYFLTEKEMKNYIELSNKMEQDEYRGFILDPLKNEYKTQNLDLKNITSYSEFEPLIKPEYKSLAKSLYNQMIEDKKEKKMINFVVGLITVLCIVFFLVVFYFSFVLLKEYFLQST